MNYSCGYYGNLRKEESSIHFRGEGGQGEGWTESVKKRNEREKEKGNERTKREENIQEREKESRETGERRTNSIPLSFGLFLSVCLGPSCLLLACVYFMTFSDYRIC